MGAQDKKFTSKLNSLLFENRKTYRNLAKELYLNSILLRETLNVLCKYEYFDNLMTSYVSTDSGKTFHRYISHPASNNKREEIWRNTYDIAWLDAKLIVENQLANRGRSN
jgi:hypothetical protein